MSEGIEVYYEVQMQEYDQQRGWEKFFTTLDDLKPTGRWRVIVKDTDYILELEMSWKKAGPTKKVKQYSEMRIPGFPWPWKKKTLVKYEEIETVLEEIEAKGFYPEDEIKYEIIYPVQECQ